MNLVPFELGINQQQECILMQQRISALDDQNAVLVLKAFVREVAGQEEPSFSAEIRESLEGAVRGTPWGSQTVTDGELARTALLVLYEEPQNRSRIEQLINASELEFLGLLETVGLATAVLVVLQTHVRFERDKDGKVHLLIEKRPSESGIVESLIQKLLAWSSMGSPGQQ